MIVVIDYNVGNVGSIKNMIHNIDFECTISSDIKTIQSAKKLILPGVGAFDNGMSNIENMGLKEVLNNKVLEEKTPVLGICLGMQLMASKSEEGVKPGLSWLPTAEVKKVNVSDYEQIKIPLMGWNYISTRKENRLISDQKQRFYFVHSYYFPIDTDGCIASANVGFDYCVAFQKDNIYGVQFHPEKSHVFGKALLKNFCKM